jgi:hypothetical protein
MFARFRCAAKRVFEKYYATYEYAVQTSEAMIDIATIRIMLNRLAPA